MIKILVLFFLLAPLCIFGANNDTQKAIEADEYNELTMSRIPRVAPKSVELILKVFNNEKNKSKPWFQSRLGDINLWLDYGIPHNLKIAKLWYEKSAKLKDDYAIFMLALLNNKTSIDKDKFIKDLRRSGRNKILNEYSWRLLVKAIKDENKNNKQIQSDLKLILLASKAIGLDMTSLEDLLKSEDKDEKKK